MSMLV